MSRILIIVTLLVFNNCKSQEEDYSELRFIYSEFVEALKSKDDGILIDFCYMLAPVESTFEFMRKNKLCYRGIPCKMDKDGIAITAIGDRIFSNLIRMRNELVDDGLLDDLVHIDSTNYKWETNIINKIPINGTEMPVILKSGNTIISYRIGEMILIDNKWSLFTLPKTSYSIEGK